MRAMSPTRAACEKLFAWRAARGKAFQNIFAEWSRRMDLQNRVTVITGATGGLGRVAAQTFAKRGARLALAATNEERLQALARELALPDERLLLYAANLQDETPMREFARAVSEKFGRAEILLQFIGGWTGGKTIAEFEARELTAMLAQHVWATWYLLQAFVPQLVANQWGRVLIVSSPSAQQPRAKSAPYAAAKAAQENLILTLAQELKGLGVTANILQVQTIDAQHERDAAPAPKNANWTTPEEIVAALLYLCSDAAHIVNGARLPLFGGG
ncbi:SDR family NAD(P)-dependent oxidoreductase [Anaerolineae bacterium CFX7]|nr:SDR family NAD(P)-dependent oxidoreductase [Anaerolineae bacterium CFX7]